jgi:plastocyanin
MKATLVLAAALAGLALASTASASKAPTLLIHHQVKGCHAWALNGGAFKAAQVLRVKRGQTLTVVDDDVMAHLLVQKSGRPVAIHRGSSSMRDMATPLHGPGLMAHMGASVQVKFTKAGVYRFTTRAGEDYTEGVKTVGEDNVLTLKVVVS